MRNPEPLVLGLRRIYIMPTRGGYAFGGVLLVMLLGSANYNNGLGYAFTFLLGSLALVSLLHSNRNLTGLRLTGGVAHPVFSGDEAGFTLHVDNRGQRDRYDLQLRYGFDPKNRADLRAVRLRLAADEQGRIEMPISTNGRGRGWLSLPRVTVASRYPLGLFRAWSDLYLDFRCLVYPLSGRDPGPAITCRRFAAGRG